MSKEESLREEKEPEGFAAFLQWIWNPNTKQFLGRTGTSWAQVGLFYVIFYACLALFWALMLKIFMTTISYEKPKWVMEESLIGLNPGLGFRPSAKVLKIDSTLIHFRPGKNDSYFPWVRDLNEFLLPYKEAYNQRSECRSVQRRDKCPFLADLSSTGCGPNFGYDTGSPCVLIKLNRVFNWKPMPYRSLADIVEGVKRNSKGVNFEPKVRESEITSGEGQISIQCEGEHAADREKLSTITYWPRQGFPAEYYPFNNQPNYLSPFVLVKFNNPTKGVAINIECIAMDKNIKINRFDREGSVSFQLLIDN